MKRNIIRVFVCIIIAFIVIGGCVKEKPVFEENVSDSTVPKKSNDGKNLQISIVQGNNDKDQTMNMDFFFVFFCFRSLVEHGSLANLYIRKAGPMDLANSEEGNLKPYECFLTALDKNNKLFFSSEPCLENSGYSQVLLYECHGLVHSINGNRTFSRSSRGHTLEEDYVDWIGLSVETKKEVDSSSTDIEIETQFVKWMNEERTDQSTNLYSPYGYDLVFMFSCLSAPPEVGESSVKDYDNATDTTPEIMHYYNTGFAGAGTLTEIRDRYGFFWKQLLSPHGVVIGCKCPVLAPDDVSLFFHALL